MTVYVDDMLMEARVGRLTARWSHLMADTREELIAFAKSIGLREAWLQDKRSGVHFDVTAGKRAQALAAGAVPIECASPEWMAVVATSREQHAAEHPVSHHALGKVRDWRPGDPCGKCGSTDTAWGDSTEGAVCRACGAADSDE